MTPPLFVNCRFATNIISLTNKQAKNTNESNKIGGSFSRGSPFNIYVYIEVWSIGSIVASVPNMNGQKD